MKKGFTLIELLAVIVLLGIVSLIATPIVIDIIDDYRESANLRSIEGYARAIKQEYYNQSMDGSIPVIDENFLKNVSTGGGDVVCENILYNYNNGVIMYKCKIPKSDNEYCYGNDKHYECDNSEFLGMITGDSDVEPESLITLLLKQYSDLNTTGLVRDISNQNIYYYTGTNDQVANNYLWYGGHQWRVLEFDENAKTLTLIAQQPLTSIQPASAVWDTKETYESSYINNWLNDYFWNSLDSDIQRNILDIKFNIGTYTEVDEILTTQKVGLLDEEQYKRAGSANSFLDIKDDFWLGNRYSSSDIRVVNDLGNLTNYSLSYSAGVRPVIKIYDLSIDVGDGTLVDSYQMINRASSTSEVQVGEYINIQYNGDDSACGSDNMCTFRVVSKNNDGIKVVLNGLLSTTSKWADSASDNITTSDLIYTNVLNGFIENIDSKFTTTGTYGVGMYAPEDSYAVPQTPTITTNIGLPTAGEMFSGNDIDLGTLNDKTFVDINSIENPIESSSYWTMNRSSSSNVRFVNANGRIGYNPYTNSYGVRPVIYLKAGTSALTFAGGEGTAQSPYVLQ